MCVFAYGIWLCLANFGWGLWWVCLGLGFSCTPLFLAWVLGRVASCARSTPTPPPPGGAACGGGFPLGVAVGGVSPPHCFCFLAVFLAAGGGSVGVVSGSVVLWLCGGGRCVSRSWPPWSLPPFVWVYPFFFVSMWPVVCHFSGGVVCWRVRGVFTSGPSAAVSTWWAAVSGWVSSGWSGLPPGVLSTAPWVSPLVVPGRGSLASVELVRGFAVVQWSPPFSFFPVGRWVCARGWVGLPPFRVCFSFGFFSRGVCLFLPVPSLGWCTHWSANGVANWPPLALVGGRGPCPGPVGGVGYAHAWVGGLSCGVRLWFCQLGGCAS